MAQQACGLKDYCNVDSSSWNNNFRGEGHESESDLMIALLIGCLMIAILSRSLLPKPCVVDGKIAEGVIQDKVALFLDCQEE